MTELPPHATPVDRIAPGTTIREWEVVRFLGRGSYGVVFEAKRSSWLHEPPRALKVFDPIVSAGARSALLAEFGALTGVRHPHLLAGIDAFDLTEPPFAGCVVFVLELADEDLSHRVARHGPLPPAEVAAVGAQVADGLSALHAEGRIHGDVKPENILRAGDRWALGDFGVSGLLEGSYAVTAGATIDYRPPELARAAEGTRLHRSADVWALGVTLHVAATARHPFPGPDPIMRFAAAVRDDRRLAPDLDPTLARIIDEGCLAADPRLRLDAPTLADHLRAWPTRPDHLPAPAPAPDDSAAEESAAEESAAEESVGPLGFTAPTPTRTSAAAPGPGDESVGPVDVAAPGAAGGRGDESVGPVDVAAPGADGGRGGRGRPAGEDSVGSLPLAPPGEAGASAVPPGAPVPPGGPTTWSPSTGALPPTPSPPSPSGPVRPDGAEAPVAPGRRTFDVPPGVTPVPPAPQVVGAPPVVGPPATTTPPVASAPLLFSPPPAPVVAPDAPAATPPTSSPASPGSASAPMRAGPASPPGPVSGTTANPPAGDGLDGDGRAGRDGRDGLAAPGGVPWVGAVVVGVLAFVATQVVAMAAGELLDGLGGRRVAYAVASLLAVGGLVAAAGPRIGSARVAAVAAGAVWAVATVALFLR